MDAAVTGTAAERAAVHIQGLSKRYGQQLVVDGLDLTIRRGECLALLGPNGAGKTTALRMLLGLTPPSRGQIRVLGLPVPAQGRAARRRTGVVPQLDNLDPDFTVRENLLSYASYFGLSPGQVADRVESLMAFAELETRAEAPIDALSGGMKRRLTLARALVNAPDLLVLDEPTTGLDPQARQHIWERLHRLQQQGRTLLLTTHYMEEAERLADRAAIMDGGRLIACDTPDALIEAAIEPQVAELRGEAARDWLRGGAPEPGVRLEHVGETVLLYAHDPERLRQAVTRRGSLRCIYRPASLEDVFLRLTGRDLRD